MILIASLHLVLTTSKIRFDPQLIKVGYGKEKVTTLNYEFPEFTSDQDDGKKTNEPVVQTKNSNVVSDWSVYVTPISGIARESFTRVGSAQIIDRFNVWKKIDKIGRCEVAFVKDEVLDLIKKVDGTSVELVVSVPMAIADQVFQFLVSFLLHLVFIMVLEK